MDKYGFSIKDDFKAMCRKICGTAKMATAGDPDKLVVFPSRFLEDAMVSADEFRVYMFNPNFKILMILPTVKTVDLEKIVSIIFECATHIDSECTCAINALSRSLKTIPEIMADEDTTSDIFFIWFFTGHRLVGYYEIDSTAACLISLCAAHLNSYDHNQDRETLDGVMRDALTELDTGDKFEKKG